MILRWGKTGQMRGTIGPLLAVGSPFSLDLPLSSLSPCLLTIGAPVGAPHPDRSDGVWAETAESVVPRSPTPGFMFGSSKNQLGN